ncbi:MAG: hypothetical protein ACLQUY_04150 [Ktedonobacterales bacterium]
MATQLDPNEFVTIELDEDDKDYIEDMDHDDPVWQLIGYLLAAPWCNGRGVLSLGTPPHYQLEMVLFDEVAKVVVVWPGESGPMPEKRASELLEWIAGGHHA